MPGWRSKLQKGHLIYIVPSTVANKSGLLRRNSPVTTTCTVVAFLHERIWIWRKTDDLSETAHDAYQIMPCDFSPSNG